MHGYNKSNEENNNNIGTHMYTLSYMRLMNKRLFGSTVIVIRKNSLTSHSRFMHNYALKGSRTGVRPTLIFVLLPRILFFSFAFAVLASSASQVGFDYAFHSTSQNSTRTNRVARRTPHTQHGVYVWHN